MLLPTHLTVLQLRFSGTSHLRPVALRGFALFARGSLESYTETSREDAKGSRGVGSQSVVSTKFSEVLSLFEHRLRQILFLCLV